MQKIVIVGGGYAGLWACLVARRQIVEAGADIAVSLVSSDGYLTMRPRLYEKDPEYLRAALAPTLDPVGVSLIEATVTSIDPPGCRIETGSGAPIAYDRLVLAAGSVMRPLELPGIAEHAHDIDSWRAAVAFDRHLKATLDSEDRPGRDTVVVIGGGFTGIELACEMRGRIARHAGSGRAAGARIVLIEKAGSDGPELGPGPRPAIEDALVTAGVETRLGTAVTSVDGDGVSLAGGGRIDARTAVVSVGLTANALGECLPVESDALGRLPVDDRLRVEGVGGIFACGDIARARVDEAGNLALMSCQHAMAMGRFAGYNAARDLLGKPLQVYRQPDYVTCLDLGPAGAVFTRGWERAVEVTGAEAKARKIRINTEIIYPPGGGREAILAAATVIAVR
ncbi:MAG: NAD(P)/FAD-dependent oxidoreductase [Alphaproteobacteria bacterium]